MWLVLLLMASIVGAEDQKQSSNNDSVPTNSSRYPTLKEKRSYISGDDPMVIGYSDCSQEGDQCSPNDQTETLPPVPILEALSQPAPQGLCFSSVCR